MLRILTSKKRQNEDLLEDQRQENSADNENSHIVEKKMKVSDSKERRKQWLLSVGYDEKRRAVMEAYEEAKSSLKPVFEKVLQSDDLENTFKTYCEKCSKLEQALKVYDQCLSTADEEKYKVFLKNHLQYDQIAAFAKETLTVTALLEGLYKLRMTKNKLDSEDLQGKITKELSAWLEAPDQLLTGDFAVVEGLLNLKNQVKQNANDLKALQNSVRQMNGILSLSKKIYLEQVKDFHEKLSSLVNAQAPAFSNKEEFFAKLVEMKKNFILLDQLERIYKQLPTSSGYLTYLESKIEAVRQDIIDAKIEITEMSQPKINTSIVSTASPFTLFSTKMKEVSTRKPITTWERNTDTTIQEMFLEQFLNDKAIKASLKSLKKDPFNISFLEYVQNGEYKVMFAISGSNDALNASVHTKNYNANGINDLVSNWVKKWNRANPGITFQFVVSYNGNNLKMDEGFWYCSEPKLAIEYSKAKKTMPSQIRIGQNNWTINPFSFNSTEQDACTRHCQHRQDELLNFNAEPKSPIRIAN